AAGLPIGGRLHSAPVIRLADSKPLQLGHTATADGRWRLFAFAGTEHPAGPSSRIQAVFDFPAEAPPSPGRRTRPAGADIAAIIDVRAVFQQDHRDLDLMAMPAFLLPAKGRLGLRDYEKMFCPDLKSGPKRGQDIFTMRSIDREGGCMVVVR